MVHVFRCVVGRGLVIMDEGDVVLHDHHLDQQFLVNPVRLELGQLLDELVVRGHTHFPPVVGVILTHTGQQQHRLYTSSSRQHES